MQTAEGVREAVDRHEQVVVVEGSEHVAGNPLSSQGV